MLAVWQEVACDKTLAPTSLHSLFHPGLPVSVKCLSTCRMYSLGALLASFSQIPGPTGCPWGIYLESDHFSQPMAPPPELPALTMVTAITSLLPTPNSQFQDWKHFINQLCFSSSFQWISTSAWRCPGLESPLYLSDTAPAPP